MVDFVATCGDSFACGSGLLDSECFEKSFGGLAADHLGVPQRVIARAGCCNFTIWLQIKHVVNEWAKGKKPFVIVSMTNSARTVWYKPFSQPAPGTQPTIEHLNYEDYSPYDVHTAEHFRRPIPVATNHIMQSETLSNLDTFFDQKIKATWPQFDRHEPNARLKTLRDWVADFFSFEIKQEYDNGILLQGHLLLKKHNIPHVFMGWQPDLQNLMDENNYAPVDWGHWSRHHPDPKGTGHCDKRGHEEVFKIIQPKIDAQL
jgi:hypothetical protein